MIPLFWLLKSPFKPLSTVFVHRCSSPVLKLLAFDHATRQPSGGQGSFLWPRCPWCFSHGEVPWSWCGFLLFSHHLGESWNGGTPKLISIIHFNGIVHCKPSVWGTPIYGNHHFPQPSFLSIGFWPIKIGLHGELAGFSTIDFDGELRWIQQAKGVAKPTMVGFLSGLVTKKRLHQLSWMSKNPCLKPWNDINDQLKLRLTRNPTVYPWGCHPDQAKWEAVLQERTSEEKMEVSPLHKRVIWIDVLLQVLCDVIFMLTM